ncbi:MAG: alpha/beta hydrolase-fold protein [Pyrinomonadaceae bacterium MAG19_C2-C3]|nr:alpha/beta hydrolase-fold protein [Pyrinomonadaceae bacterium MAG19_C2-C3]
MNRRITSWYSHNLGTEMPLVAYGHAGHPLLMFPTAAADFLEYERFNLIDAIAHHVDAGRVRLYSINSVNRYSLLNEGISPPHKAAILTAYDRYITDEVLPLIRQDVGNGDVQPMTTGASLGAYLAANAFFKHSDMFAGTIPMSGSYDVREYMDGYTDDNLYFNNPVQYLSNLDDDYHLPRLRHRDARSIVILTGQGAFEAPERSRELSAILHTKGIPHTLDVWGHDVAHDWVWWRKMLDLYVDKLF